VAYSKVQLKHILMLLRIYSSTNERILLIKDIHLFHCHKLKLLM